MDWTMVSSLVPPTESYRVVPILGSCHLIAWDHRQLCLGQLAGKIRYHVYK